MSQQPRWMLPFQAQILDLLRTLKDKINSSIMLITHDLGVVAEMADYVVVMYAGRIIEKGTADEVFKPSLPPLPRLV
jgi:peptide/nickel transport system ATP-binding protein